jgi:hypothetical protein
MPDAAVLRIVEPRAVRSELAGVGGRDVVAVSGVVPVVLGECGPRVERKRDDEERRDEETQRREP